MELKVPTPEAGDIQWGLRGWCQVKIHTIHTQVDSRIGGTECRPGKDAR